MVQQTAQQATSDPQLRQRAVDAALDIVKQLLAADKVPTQVAGEAQRAIRQVTGNRDPYREWKDKEMSRAKKLFDKVKPKYSNDIRSLVTLSAIGNMPDFFRDIGVVEQEMMQPVVFAKDHVNRLADVLEASRSTLFISDESMDNLICFVPGVNLCMKKVLFLADNAGECYFDAPLVKDISQVMRINYVVKSFPVQNDLTQEELGAWEERFGSFFSKHTKKELQQEAIARDIMLFPVNSVADLLSDEQLRAREYWTEVEHPEMNAVITYPGEPFKSAEAPWRISSRAPLVGEHNAEVYEQELGIGGEELQLLKEQGVI